MLLLVFLDNALNISNVLREVYLSVASLILDFHLYLESKENYFLSARQCM